MKHSDPYEEANDVPTERRPLHLYRISWEGPSGLPLTDDYGDMDVIAESPIDALSVAAMIYDAAHGWGSFARLLTGVKEV